jgi:hypothetical protein
MADTPTFALNTVPGTVITLPGYEKGRTIEATVVYLIVEGLTKPKGFRSPSRYEKWDIVAIFNSFQRTLAQTFMTMLDTAYTQVDGRLIMTLGGIQSSYASRTVEASPYVETIDKVSGITRVAFTATEVDDS